MKPRKTFCVYLELTSVLPPSTLLSLFCFRKTFVFGLAQLKLFFLPSVWRNFPPLFQQENSSWAKGTVKVFSLQKGMQTLGAEAALWLNFTFSLAFPGHTSIQCVTL